MRSESRFRWFSICDAGWISKASVITKTRMKISPDESQKAETSPVEWIEFWISFSRQFLMLNLATEWLYGSDVSIRTSRYSETSEKCDCWMRMKVQASFTEKIEENLWHCIKWNEKWNRDENISVCSIEQSDNVMISRGMALASDCQKKIGEISTRISNTTPEMISRLWNNSWYREGEWIASQISQTLGILLFSMDHYLPDPQNDLGQSLAAVLLSFANLNSIRTRR
jgi:hypothetical protein